jgi:hypothetical protein
MKLGSALTDIGALTFYNCRSLQAIEIPDTVSLIGYSAFYNCTSLASVVIGSGVEDIGTSAFENCLALKSILFNSGAPSVSADWIANHNLGLVIKCYNGASGFTTPFWEGVGMEVIGSRLAAPNNLTSVLGPASISLSWSGLRSDVSPSVDYYIVYQDGVDVKHVNGNSTKFTGLEANGTYTYQVSAHSLSVPGMNSTSLVAGPVVELVPVKVTIVTPAESSEITTKNATIRWTASGNSFAIAYFLISIDDGPQIRLSSAVKNYTIDGPGNGPHHANITAADDLGNSVTRQVSFTVNNTANASNDNTMLFVVIAIALAAMAAVAVLVYRRRNGSRFQRPCLSNGKRAKTP